MRVSVAVHMGSVVAALVVVHRGLAFAMKSGTSCNSELYRGSGSPRGQGS